MVAYTDGKDILVRRDGSRLFITLNRPHARNALTHAMIKEFGAVIEVLKGDPELRVVVVRGAGGHFCAGGDLNMMTDMPPAPAPGQEDPLVASYRYYGEAFAALDKLPQAVIAVVEGSAVGSGLGMACCSDVVIAHQGATFGMPEPRVGFIPSQIIPFVTRRLGVAQARRLAVTGERINGRKAVELGIAHFYCTSSAEIESTLASVLDQINKCAPAAVAAVKRLVLSVEDTPLNQVLDDAAQSLVSLLRAPNAKEGITAFMEKRRPPWAN